MQPISARACATVAMLAIASGCSRHQGQTTGAAHLSPDKVEVEFISMVATAADLKAIGFEWTLTQEGDIAIEVKDNIFDDFKTGKADAEQFTDRAKGIVKKYQTDGGTTSGSTIHDEAPRP